MFQENSWSVKDKESQTVVKLNTQKIKVMSSSPITSWQIDGETMKTVRDFNFWGSEITPDGGCSHEIKRCLLLGRKAMMNLDSILKSRGITLPTKVLIVKVMVFPVVIYGCESWTNKESWTPKKWCFWSVVLEKTLESSLDCKEIKPVNPKENLSWIYIGRTYAEADAPVLWPPDVKNCLLGKDLDDGKDRRQEEKRMRKDEIVGRHHWLDGHEFEQAPSFSDRQGSLACCIPWDHKELYTTEQLN